MTPESGTPSLADNVGSVDKLAAFSASYDKSTGKSADSGLMDERDDTSAETPLETAAPAEIEYTEDTTSSDDTKDTSEEGQGQGSEGLLNKQSAKTTETGALTPTSKARDYSGIDPSDVPYFKAMSNQAFAKAQEWYKKSREGDGKYTELQSNFDKIKDMRFYEHPEAYLLSEDYTKLSKSAEQSTRLANHWRRSLALIKAGKPFNDILVNQETGELTEGAMYDPTPEAEALVTDALQRCNLDVREQQAKLSALKADYGARHKTFNENLSRIERDLLTEVRTNPEFQKLEAEILNTMIPAELRGVRQYQLMAGMGAFIRALSQELNKRNAQLAGKQAIKKVARANGPGEGQAPANGNVSQVPEDPRKFIENLKRHVGRA